MDKKNITIIIGVVIVLTVVLGVGIYLLVKQAPKINNQTQEANSEQINIDKDRIEKWNVSKIIRDSQVI